MSAGHTVTTRPSEAHVEVRVGGELLASTDRALELDETGLPTRYYLPREDVRMDLLARTEFHTTCPFKGEASYWTIEAGGARLEGVVWSYETPKADVAEIAGYLSFYPNKVELTADGSPVTS
jgi:uncharacterized protein (DUF427 family)